MPHNDISNLQTHLGYWLRLVSNSVSDSFARQLEQHGVTVSEWVALRLLYDLPDATHADLTQRMGLTKGAVSKVIARLQEKQLLSRQGDADDARALRLRLTAAGEELVPRLAALADANDAQFFAALSSQQQDQLRSLLTQLAESRQLQLPPLA
ncbi:MarR family transcriptional regulator [uncultured Aquitalea sp.]|uniref:MarR family winged helix-turn-helix transcriptional regulator n=1 Tax=uncultured Aquitalea sp. TaxID=540272 RepID=UPI0025E8A207|nr:MarR family transcriptional regulator [uncultured Aquitalea sp.]